MNAKNQPTVYITLINWNSLEDTSHCLDSLAKLAYPAAKVIVVDNGSANHEADELAKRFPEATLIRNASNLGFTGGCNAGIDLALKDAADYVLLLNNDTIVEPDFLTKMINFYEGRKDAGMVSPLILYTDKKRVWFAGGQVALGMIRHVHKGKPLADTNLPKEAFASDYVPGTALLISTDLIKKIGKLNDKYFAYYEDLEWSYKAQQLGYKTYVLPSAVIYHKKSGSTSEGGHKRFTKIPAYYIARNAIYFARNLHGLQRLWYLACQVFLKLPLSLALLVKPNAWGSYLKGLFDGFRTAWTN